MPTRDVILLRVSSDEQAADERLSLATQDARCRASSAASGGEVLRVFVEEQTSWVDELERRPVLVEAIRYAVENKASRFWVYRFDRFARDKYVFFTADHILKKAGIALLSTLEHHEPGTPTGELLKGVHALLAEADSAKKSEVVRDNLRQKVLSGRWVGKRPYGYCKGTCDHCVEPTGNKCPRHEEGEPVRGRLRTVPSPLTGGEITVPVMVPRPVEADGYRFLVKLCLDGVETFREMARVMNAAGYRSVLGNPWNGTTVQLTLTNPAHTGMVVLREPGTLVRRNAMPGLHEALVDRETWERIQRRCRELSNGQAGMHKAARPYALSGVLYCARCGYRLIGMQTNRPAGQRYYRCSQRNHLGAAACDLPMFRAEDCEETVARLLDSFAMPPGWQEQVLEGINAPRPGPSLSDLAAEEKRLTQMYQDGYVSYEDFKTRWQKVQEKRERVRPPEVAGVLELGALLSRGLGVLWRQSPDQVERRRLARAVFRGVYLDGERGKPPDVVRLEWQPEVEPLSRYFREM